MAVFPIDCEIQLCEGLVLAVGMRRRPPRYKQVSSNTEWEVINHQTQMLDISLPWVLLAVESTGSQLWDPNLLLILHF